MSTPKGSRVDERQYPGTVPVLNTRGNQNTDPVIMLTVFNIRPAQLARLWVVSADRIVEARSRHCTASQSLNQPRVEQKMTLVRTTCQQDERCLRLSIRIAKNLG